MELALTSETVLEHAREIQGLKYFIDVVGLNLHNGFIQDPDGRISQDLKRKKERFFQLTEEIKLFGIDDSIPSEEQQEKVIPRVTWLGRVRSVDYQEYYDSIVCSACPLSLGLEVMAENGDIPCGAIQGSIRTLEKPYQCCLISFNRVKEKELPFKILQEFGEEALQVFEKKEAELKTQNPQ